MKYQFLYKDWKAVPQIVLGISQDTDQPTRTYNIPDYLPIDRSMAGKAWLRNYQDYK